jgi:hypothetical protein
MLLIFIFSKIATLGERNTRENSNILGKIRHKIQINEIVEVCVVEA